MLYVSIFELFVLLLHYSSLQLSALIKKIGLTSSNFFGNSHSYPQLFSVRHCTVVTDSDSPLHRATMNIFRITADLSHLASIFILLHKMQTSRVSTGFDGGLNGEMTDATMTDMCKESHSRRNIFTFSFTLLVTSVGLFLPSPASSWGYGVGGTD